MAHGGSLSLRELINKLKEMAQPVPNDDRQKKYCEYISLFLSYYSNERFALTGSTPQRTRLRAFKNEGDFDYLVISSKRIPAELLEHHPKVPCFVKIKGDSLRSTFPEVKMIDGKYLPSFLLSEANPKAFRHARNIFQLVTLLGHSKGRHTLHIYLDQKIKPGMSRINYVNPVCPNINERLVASNKNILYRIQDSKIEPNNELLNGMLYIATSAVNNYKKLEERFLPRFQSQNTSRKSRRGHESHGSSTKIAKMGDKTLSFSFTTKETSTSISDTQPSYSGTHRTSSETIYERTKQMSSNSKEDMVKIWYESKSSKDFILVFPIDGKLAFLEKWKRRPERVWPSPKVVEDICTCEFYVIAKPALVNPETDKDFCLAFNNAEMKLSDAMKEVQRIVMLIIKAFQKGILKEYSEEVTSFHWKTVVYWVSEQIDESVLLENTDENIQRFLLRVLEFMTDCLFEKNLTHYFLPSNLFAEKDEDVPHEVAIMIVEIQENSIEYLQKFISTQQNNEMNCDMVPLSKIKEFNNSTGSSEIELLLRALRGFTSEGKDKLKAALKHVATEGFPYFIEELSRGHDENKTCIENQMNQMLHAFLNQNVAHDALIDSAVSLLINESSKDAPNIQEITGKMFSIVLQNVLGL